MAANPHRPSLSSLFPNQLNFAWSLSSMLRPLSRPPSPNLDSPSEPSHARHFQMISYLNGVLVDFLLQVKIYKFRMRWETVFIGFVISGDWSKKWGIFALNLNGWIFYRLNNKFHILTTSCQLSVFTQVFLYTPRLKILKDKIKVGKLLWRWIHNYRYQLKCK